MVAGDTEAKPQNVEGKLGVLTIPLANSCKGQMVTVVEMRERKGQDRTGPAGQHRTVLPQGVKFVHVTILMCGLK